MGKEKTKFCLSCGLEMSKTADTCPHCGSDCSSSAYSQRERWIKRQFSVWSGEHKTFSKIVLDNIPDKKAFEHIKTKYSDMDSLQALEELNALLEKGNYPQRAELGDLCLNLIFSMYTGEKDELGHKIKDRYSAIGLVRGKDSSVEFLGFERFTVRRENLPNDSWSKGNV